MAMKLPTQRDDETQKAGDEQFAPTRFRAVLLGFLLCFPVLYAVANQWSGSIVSLAVPPISALMLLVAANVPLRRFAPRWTFSQTDLIVVFSIVSVAAAVGGEWVLYQLPGIYGLPLGARNQPVYRDQLMKYVPDWAAIKDLSKVQEIGAGGHGMGYVLGKLPMYLPYFAAWGVLIVSLCFAMQCINSLMRGAWCERERLTFPLIQLPVAMAEDGGAGGMWKSRHMWIAFAIMFGIDILNGLNYLYPNIPAIPVKDLILIDPLFKDPPWSNIGDFRLSIYPFMAAIGLFMPSDMLLSFVVFFLLRAGTHVLLAANGIPQSTFSGTGASPGPPYFDEQTWGAVIAMFMGAIWVSKDYLKEVWRDIRTGKRADDGGVKHRWAFAGLIASYAVMVAFGAVGGIPVIYLVPYVGAFLVFSIVLTRIRAQLGPPTHEFAFFGSGALMNRFVGTRWMTDAQATWATQGYLVMNRIFRNHPMPYQLEAMKMSRLQQLNAKRTFLLIAAAVVVGYFVGMFFKLDFTYRTGSVSGTEAASYLQHILGDRKGPDVVGITMTIVGFAVVMLLDAIRFRFPGFPLHPAGYILSMNFGVDYYWFGLLLALFVKNFVQRYYGLRGYDKLRAVALGILLGEYAAETIWMAMALITKQSTYTISFNDRSLGAQ